MADPEHVLVPALVGLDMARAHNLAQTAQVTLTVEDPDTDLPLGGVVSAQVPQAGTQVLPGDPVMVSVHTDPGDGGGGGGGGSGPDPDDPRPKDRAGVK